MPVNGIDVSHYQGAVDWTKVAANASFAFIKATEGETSIDPKFASNWAGAQAVGLPVGAYHFFDPAQDAGIQAQHFCDVLDTVTGKRLPPVLDIEKTGGVSQALILTKVQKWMDLVEQHAGQKPLLYTYTSFATQIRLSKAFSAYKLWVAQYGVKTPRLCGWAAWTFWQRSQTGKIPGITGSVDLNQFAGTIGELHALLA
jgi:GH25 family lysozyme M1 (1,4-beta-N-acetylmuramidase)